MATQPTALDQSFACLCDQYGIDTLSLSYSVRAAESGGRWFTVFAHRKGECAGEHGDTIAEAIGKAIAALNAKNIALADEPLTVEAQQP